MNKFDIDYQNYDRAFKDAFTTFKEKVPPFLDFDLPQIDSFLETEFVEIQTKENRIDMNFLLKDKTILHLEEEVTLSHEDIIRFAEYDLKLYNRYETKIHTVVFCINKVNLKKSFIDAGTLKYNVNIVDFSEKDGDRKLEELKQVIKEGKDINELELIFLPLMRSKLNKIDLVKEVVNLEIQISEDEAFKQKLVAITLVMSDKLINREELNSIWEEIRMFKFIEYAEGKGIEKGVDKGVEKATTVAAMLLKGESEDAIIKETGLNSEQINKIKEIFKAQGAH